MKFSYKGSKSNMLKGTVQFGQQIAASGAELDSTGISKAILGIASAIYNQYDKMQNNKELCNDLISRVRLVDQVVKDLYGAHQIGSCKETLEELSGCLNECLKLIESINKEESSKTTAFLLASNIEASIHGLIKRLHHFVDILNATLLVQMYNIQSGRQKRSKDSPRLEVHNLPNKQKLKEEYVLNRLDELFRCRVFGERTDNLAMYNEVLKNYNANLGYSDQQHIFYVDNKPVATEDALVEISKIKGRVIIEKVVPRLVKSKKEEQPLLDQNHGELVSSTEDIAVEDMLKEQLQSLRISSDEESEQSYHTACSSIRNVGNSRFKKSVYKQMEQSLRIDLEQYEVSTAEQPGPKITEDEEINGFEVKKKDKLNESLGCFYLYGKNGYPQNNEEAFNHFKKEAKEGNDASMYNLALMYFSMKKYEKSLLWGNTALATTGNSAIKHHVEKLIKKISKKMNIQ